HPVFYHHAQQSLELYALSLHDALPISIPIALIIACERYSSIPTSRKQSPCRNFAGAGSQLCWNPTTTAGSIARIRTTRPPNTPKDRKSTRLNSSHVKISYAVFC